MKRRRTRRRRRRRRGSLSRRRRRRGRPKQLVYDLKDERILEIVRGSANRTIGRTPFGIAYGPDVRRYY